MNSQKSLNGISDNAYILFFCILERVNTMLMENGLYIRVLSKYIKYYLRRENKASEK